MLRNLTQAMTSRAAGPAASAIAVGLAGALALTWSAAETRRVGLEQQIADLKQQAERSQSLWRAQLTACHAVSGAQRLTRAAYSGEGAAASQLLAQGPEGIDACARMESADQAVLQNLK